MRQPHAPAYGGHALNFKIRILFEKSSDFVQKPQQVFIFIILALMASAEGGRNRRSASWRGDKLLPHKDLPRSAWRENNFFVLEEGVRNQRILKYLGFKII